MFKSSIFSKKETAGTSFDTSYNTNSKNKEAYQARNIRRENPSVSYSDAYKRVDKGDTAPAPSWKR